MSKPHRSIKNPRYDTKAHSEDVMKKWAVLHSPARGKNSTPSGHVRPHAMNRYRKHILSAPAPTIARHWSGTSKGTWILSVIRKFAFLNVEDILCSWTNKNVQNCCVIFKSEKCRRNVEDEDLSIKAEAHRIININVINLAHNHPYNKRQNFILININKTPTQRLFLFHCHWHEKQWPIN